MFANDTDPMIAEMRCQWDNFTIHSGLADQYYFAFHCYRTEKLLGYLTLMCMFIPGLLLSLFLSFGLTTRLWMVIIFTPICTVLFPFLTISIKVHSSFQQKKTINKYPISLLTINDLIQMNIFS